MVVFVDVGLSRAVQPTPTHIYIYIYICVGVCAVIIV